MKNRYFTRAILLLGLYRNAVANYGLEVDELNLPVQLFDDPMNLIPTAEVNKWLLQLEGLSQDPDVVINLLQSVDIEKLGPIGHWFFSETDLSTTIRRINTGISSLQSGAFLAGEQVGQLLKWVYKNPSMEADAKIHDGVRVAVFMVKVLRRYLGESFQPTRVMLPGKGQDLDVYQRFFKCDIGWNHDKVEVWFNAKKRFTLSHVTLSAKAPLAMSFTDLDRLFNMPDPADEIKVIYETIAYSRHAELPNVENVARLLGLSRQQFSRRLRSLGMNFSTISNYVLSNLAVNLLSRGYGIEEVSQNLGYTHVASFNRMFKRQRGITPLQYLDIQ